MRLIGWIDVRRGERELGGCSFRDLTSAAGGAFVLGVAHYCYLDLSLCVQSGRVFFVIISRCIAG